MSSEICKQMTKPVLVIQLRELDSDYEPKSEHFDRGVTLSISDINYINQEFETNPTLKILQRYSMGDIVDALIDRLHVEGLSCMAVDVQARNYCRKPAKQMTLKEIEEELGYKVEIIDKNF